MAKPHWLCFAAILPLLVVNVFLIFSDHVRAKKKTQDWGPSFKSTTMIHEPRVIWLAGLRPALWRTSRRSRGFEGRVLVVFFKKNNKWEEKEKKFALWLSSSVAGKNEEGRARIFTTTPETKTWTAGVDQSTTLHILRKPVIGELHRHFWLFIFELPWLGVRCTEGV